MKKFIKSLAVVVLSFVSMSEAEAQKVAHINLDSLISLMPEYKEAEKGVQEYAAELQQQIAAMQAELETKYTEYQTSGKDMAEIVRASKEKEINDLNQRIQEFQQQAQVDYQKKSTELTLVVVEKAKKAINEVAKTNKYKYVLDTSTGVVLYFEPTEDIFKQVAAKLGLK